MVFVSKRRDGGAALERGAKALLAPINSRQLAREAEFRRNFIMIMQVKRQTKNERLL
jgi:hypothetical protein